MQRLAELMRSVSPRLNEAALVIGLLSCFGMCVVATFQVSVSTCWHKNTPSLENTSNAFAFLFTYNFFFLPLSGNSSGKCSSSWSPAVLCVWCCLYDPPVYYIVPYLSTWLIRHSVQSAREHHNNSRAGVSTEYPFILPPTPEREK